MGIINTMNNEIITALELLKGTGVSIVDAARLIKNILDAKTANFKLSNAQYCAKVIDVGTKSIRWQEMSFSEGLKIYYENKKQSLRPDSLRDIRIIGRRLMRSNPDFAKRNFSELTRADCEDWLSTTYTTPSQFNKARAMLHGIFQFALRREWCDKNQLKLIERKKVIEKEIKPLTLQETKLLLNNANKSCSAAVGLLTLAGMRPREVRRIEWEDIDMHENSIKVRALCSKTGGVRHVEICPALKRVLTQSTKTTTKVCPRNWKKQWKDIRDLSGFKGKWIQDVLRHTYASFHAKYFHDLPRLQLNMGHRDIYLLRSRYVNMHRISKKSAKKFFY